MLEHPSSRSPARPAGWGPRPWRTAGNSGRRGGRPEALGLHRESVRRRAFRQPVGAAGSATAALQLDRRFEEARLPHRPGEPVGQFREPLPQTVGAASASCPGQVPPKQAVRHGLVFQQLEEVDSPGRVSPRTSDEAWRRSTPARRDTGPGAGTGDRPGSCGPPSSDRPGCAGAVPASGRGTSGGVSGCRGVLRRRSRSSLLRVKGEHLVRVEVAVERLVPRKRAVQVELGVAEQRAFEHVRDRRMPGVRVSMELRTREAPRDNRDLTKSGSGRRTRAPRPGTERQ